MKHRGHGGGRHGGGGFNKGRRGSRGSGGHGGHGLPPGFGRGGHLPPPGGEGRGGGSFPPGGEGRGPSGPSGHYLYGLNTIRETLEAGRRRCRHLYVETSRRDPLIQQILDLARQRSIPVSFIDAKELDRMSSGANHQGAILKADAPKALDLSDALRSDPPGPKTLWLGLDGITDPQNLGAILRNASCMGAGAVLLPERRSATVTPVVERIASGAAGRVPVVDVGNLNRGILELKEKGFWVYGSALEGRPLNEVEFKGPVLLLIGSEGEGLRKMTREHCDELVRIPQAKGAVESLNAASATAILLYEARRRLGF